VINTGTTIVTFLMVFLIQRAHNALLDLEELEDGAGGWVAGGGVKTRQ
jgi:low affinity Fe/Cu permease